MEHSEVAAVLIQLGYSVENGYVVSGRFRYGKLTGDGFVPEGLPPIPWDGIRSFSDCNEGSNGHFLEIAEADGTGRRLPRVELSGPQDRNGLRPNPNGNGYLMPSSISDLVNAWQTVFPGCR